ncbi:MAG TPA: asparagine synthase (glutamine-hydrolyzing) [Gemmatimonadaceae bacterium]|nr:asparagine synthase (glutamine-hydrolyzing) [Gemmatimonadaceae bacterium]
MCGIAGGVGIARDARPDRRIVDAMSCGLTHRGPDGDGHWASPDERARLAHRRLSVIDLATGAQPMVTPDGSIGIVFNGEIYNYKELRADLLKGGATFRTQSDTEVLLRLYERHGPSCVNQLRGMFAFAIWDHGRGRLVLARDRIGKKPLYILRRDGCLYFASALGAVKQVASGRNDIDLAALDSYLTLGYIPAPRTIFTNIEKLEAATLVVIENGVETRSTFWDIGPLGDVFPGSFEDAVDQVDAILGTAVDIRLRSDVPLGVFLSGGIDSSLVTAIAARRSQLPVSTFSIGFDDPAFDESAYAARIAQHLGTTHHQFHVRPDVVSLLPQYVRHFGEPFADSSAFPTWVLAEETRTHVTVALGGDGGDEGFAGYDWYATAQRLDRLGQLIPQTAAALGSRAMERLAARGGAATARIGRLGRGLSVIGSGGAGARFAALRSFIADSDVRRLYAGSLAAHRREEGPADVEWLARLYDEAAGSNLRRMRYVDIRSYLADCLMPKVDVATMAHGLEARAPLLDQELIQFALSLPDEYLFDERGGKRPLRTLLERYVPAPLFERQKQGFTPPFATWFGGALQDGMRALARSEALLSHGWFSPNGIEQIVDEHTAGHRDNSQRLFELMVLDAWMRTQ